MRYTLDQLPVEILTLVAESILDPLPIYDYEGGRKQRLKEQQALYSLCLVSRLLNRIALPLLWRDPHITFRVNKMEAFLAPMMSRPSVSLAKRLYANVSRLDLRDVQFHQHSLPLLFKLLRLCPYLETLGIRSDLISESILEAILDFCPGIVRLSLRGKVIDTIQRPSHRLSYVNRSITMLDLHNGTPLHFIDCFLR